ncbi:MAG: hypothetical protein D6695_04650, partial [Planctomycetota bacterium]
HALENRGRVSERTYEADSVTLGIQIGARAFERVRAGARGLVILEGGADAVQTPPEAGWGE